MATRWSAAFGRVAAIVAGTYGTGRTVTASTFRSDRYAAELGEPERPLTGQERTFELRPIGVSFDPPLNPLCSNQLHRIACELVVAYVHAQEIAEVPAAAGESQSTAARLRAIDDLGMVERALSWPANWGALSNDTTLVGVIPGAQRFETLDDVTLSVLPLELLVASSNVTAWDLGSAPS